MTTGPAIVIMTLGPAVSILISPHTLDLNIHALANCSRIIEGLYEHTQSHLTI